MTVGGSTFGVALTGNQLRLSVAGNSAVKAGVASANPITPATQHSATFYGLAKAAGVDMASSNNAVGTYTDAAKTAIKSMIGVPDSVYDLNAGTAISASDDLNNYTTPGIYNANSTVISSIAHAPTTTVAYKLVVESIADDDSYIRQIAILNSATTKTYERIGHSVNSVWTFSDWISNITNLDYATNSVGGIVKIGEGISINQNGAISISSPIPTKTSDLVNDSGFITGMTILSYGSSTWNDFITAYNANKVVYCRASSNSNPATGSQTRLAFMAYVDNATTPTNVEFQYYRSVSSHSASQQGDQVYVYKLTSAGTWTVTVREAMSKIAAGTNMSLSYSNGTITLNSKWTVVTNVSGATPVITAEADTRYICGEVTSLSFTPCASGICDVRFTSGSTVTVLTLPNTVKMPDWFDASVLEANTIYEINILDGVYGVVTTWAV